MNRRTLVFITGWLLALLFGSLAGAAGEVVIDVLSANEGRTTMTPGAGQTQQWNNRSGSGRREVRGAGSTSPGAASVTMSWRLNRRQRFALGAVSIIPLSRQADGMIRVATEPVGAFLTDDLYENPVVSQRKAFSVVSGSTASYSLRFENDGPSVDDLLISGTASGAGLPAGAIRDWTLNVTPAGSPTPVPGGNSYRVTVTTASVAAPAASDQLEAITSSISAKLTLVKSVDKVTGTPEDLTYTIVATNGSGLGDAANIVVGDPIPANTGYRIGSDGFNAGSSSLSGVVNFSSDGPCAQTSPVPLPYRSHRRRSHPSDRSVGACVREVRPASPAHRRLHRCP